MGEKYVWWCGGRSGAYGGPEVWCNVPLGETPHGEVANRVWLPHAEVICSGCHRLAPFQNGCRYVTKSQLSELENSE